VRIDLPADQELIQRIRAGDPDAVGELYGRYSSMVWRYVYARMRDEHASQDVLSETFLAAIRSLNKGMTAENILGWLTGIAKNKIADYYRSRKEYGELQTDPTTQVPSPIKATVADVLDAMPLDQRQVLEWKYFDRCSVSEIAQRMDRTEKSVEAILYRARITFREQYQLALQ
jgi:RNA polymerase sigma-70 factor (ECF subfamily)